VTLDREDVEAVAVRVVELLEERAAEALVAPVSTLVSAKVVAARYGKSREWVYAHADELGARRVGSGSKPRPLFDLAEVDRRLSDCTAGRRSEGPGTAPVVALRRRARRSAGSDVELLPVRGARGG
jgi:hypothetical protein